MNDNKLTSIVGSFPSTRLRRLRQYQWSRKMTNENNLSVNNLILPIFITSSEKSSYIDTMPGIKRYTLNEAVEVACEAETLGVPAIALFPEVDDELKDPYAKEALNDNNLICRVVKKIKLNTTNLGIICDVALDPYTKTGHDGLLINNLVDNDKTIDILCKQALVNAKAGCSIIAPSDMMDGRIGKIRAHLDINGFENIMIMSYAVKYNSAFYGPFRDAIKSGSKLGKDGKSSYQMNINNSNEAMREVAMDIQEGADMIIIKPGMPYLDVIYRVKEKFKFPTYAFQVSGEYSMIMSAIKNNYLNKEKVIIESLSSFTRAGASGIISYFALDAAKIMRG